jgi:hypothetical protein
MRIRNYLHAHRICKQAEACLNHRPLWAASATDNSILAVTPFQFLSVEVNPSKDLTQHTNETEIDILKQLKSAQTTAMGILWYKVRMSLLTELQKFHAKRTTKAERVLKVGDLVLMKNDWAARSHWPIAKITKVLPDAKGHIRTVEVSKYVPNAINTELSKSLYGIHTEGRLTKNQLRQVSGFFKPMETAQAVKNLVQFELWDPDKTDTLLRGASPISSVEHMSALPKWYRPRFETFMKPSSPGMNEIYRVYQPIVPQAHWEAKRIVHSALSSVDETPFIQVRMNRITCGI